VAELPDVRAGWGVSVDKITTALLAGTALALPYEVSAQVLSTLPYATTPYTGQEICYMVQGGVSKEYYCATAGSSGPGGVSKVVCGAGFAGGTITATGTCSLAAIGPGQVVGNASTLTAVPSGVLLISGVQYSFASTTAVGAGTYLVANGCPWVELPCTIDSVAVITQGTSSPGYTIDVQINGTDVTGCNSVSVGTTWTQAACTAANTFGTADQFTFIVSNVSGTPDLSGPMFRVTHSVQ